MDTKVEQVKEQSENSVDNELVLENKALRKELEQLKNQQQP
jgi:hypothetical protein